MIIKLEQGGEFSGGRDTAESNAAVESIPWNGKWVGLVYMESTTIVGVENDSRIVQYISVWGDEGVRKCTDSNLCFRIRLMFKMRGCEWNSSWVGWVHRPPSLDDGGGKVRLFDGSSSGQKKGVRVCVSRKSAVKFAEWWGGRSGWNYDNFQQFAESCWRGEERWKWQVNQ